MLDVALLTANASQLKYLLQVGHTHEFYTIMVSLISTSIILQILIGFVLVVKYRFNINKEHQQCAASLSLQILVGAFIVLVGTVNLNKEKNHFRANVLNNMVTIFIFMITVINIIISAFGLGE
ncbi:ninjurin-2-like isoform X4 [Varroa jacobsoni]|nr:ninjurin-2-like isoform X4 [Varroa jacobsoni]